MPPVTAPVMATAGSPVVEKHASCHGYGGESCSGKACFLSWLRIGTYDVGLLRLPPSIGSIRGGRYARGEASPANFN
ncbi:Hypp892 [Branchiostoma lanceolatum]|uniref:Hypp892 protein n=1 Tax=Branchiostoma lanceolatum TaxID=7740 RepID=A0A8J9VWP5_BRALA|nr:Hypp892 [Branchiostoma lanceolatum]